jgi:hypothetical protein
LRIEVKHKLRTLKRAARKQLERDREPQRWILPSFEGRKLCSGAGQSYPQASLLGLPNELRQHILYQSYCIRHVEDDARSPAIGFSKQAWTSTVQSVLLQSKQHNMLVRPSPHSYEKALVLVLNRKIGEYSRISALIRQGMEYISKRMARGSRTTSPPSTGFPTTCISRSRMVISTKS